jgi:hypothetical protein
MEIRFSMANGMFVMKMDINRHRPRLMRNNCQHLDPPYFSLPTTFKVTEEVTEERSRIWIRTEMSRIPNTDLRTSLLDNSHHFSKFTF